MQIVNAVLLPEHYKSIEGIEPEALLGIVNAWTAVASLVSNLMFGNFSDRSRSRFGRRTPWIVFGAVLGGVTLFLTGMTTNPILLTVLYCLCMFGLNAMIAPCVAILSDRVPSGIRGTMSAFYGAGSTVGAPIGVMLGAVFITNMVPGFAVAGVFGNEIADPKVGERLVHLKKRNKVAIMISNESLSALDWFLIEAGFPFGGSLKYNDVVRNVYDALFELNVECDFVPVDAPAERLAKYEMIVAPALYATPQETTDNLREFVANGGYLVATLRSFVTDDEVTIWHDRAPHNLTVGPWNLAVVVG